MADLIVLTIVAVILIYSLSKTVKKFGGNKKGGKNGDHDCGGGCGCGCC